MLLLLASMAMYATAWAHNGEDHGDAAAAPVAAPGAGAGMLTTYAVTEIFELLLRYQPPPVGKNATLRFFLSDYATNRALDGGLDLAFTPAGVTIVSPPAMKSPGIFEAVVSFPADTVYSLVATVRSGRRSDFMELKNIYTGAHAEHFLADHGGTSLPPSSSSPGWPWWALAGSAALLIAVVALWLRMRRAGRAAASDINRTETEKSI
jgi:hypothetical protein